MAFNLADVFELAVDQYHDREYLICDGRRCTYGEMEARANQLAHHLAEQGIGPGDHVGIYAFNSIEWVETLWAVFKLRAVWININYRYVADELAYLFENADLKALVVQNQFTGYVAEVIDALPDLQHILCIDDGTEATELSNTIAYETALAGQSIARDFPPRSDDDRYMIYTGGTTGMPKGVIWRHEDVFFALGGGIDQVTGEAVTDAQQVVDRGEAMQMCFYALAPLMHGASQWAVMGGAFEGRKVVISARFDAQASWELIEQEKINGLFITGDAMASPMLDAYKALDKTLDLSSLFLLVSSAVVFSADLKKQYRQHFPNLMILDSIGASETGGTGMAMTTDDNVSMKGGPTVKPGQGTVVLDPDTLTPLPAGSETMGYVARTGYIPLGYYKDEKKTAETFVTGADGKRYAMPGDFALHEADGTITMLGRGSVCINSGGEKIFPEEVESAIKSHPSIADAIVVGVKDRRWGSRVSAVIQLRDKASIDLASLQEHSRQFIAGYKVPRELHIVDHIERSPSGKPDYPWARNIAESGDYILND